MKRVLIIANKNWEVEPILGALLNYKIRAKQLRDPDLVHYPWHFLPGTTQPRAIWDTFSGITIELWCIQDLMDPKWHSSSSQGKNTDLPKAINYRPEKPDLIIACGTAAYGNENENNNGCVVIGSNVFIHNFHPNGENPKSVWDDPINFEKLLTSSIEPSFFELLNFSTVKSIEEKLLRPYLNSSDHIQILASKNLLALSSVNITEYGDFACADQIGIDAINKAGINLRVGSVETTHGVIRLQSEAPFVFISGITDRLNHFNDDINGFDFKGNIKTEAQNFTASFNIGVCLSWLIPQLPSYFQTLNA
jgi:hypothetical protein